MFASLQFQETLRRHTNLITSNSFTRLTPNLHLWTTTVSLAVVSPNMLKKFKSIKFVSLFLFYSLNWKSQKLLQAGINYLLLQNRKFQKPKNKNLLNLNAKWHKFKGKFNIFRITSLLCWSLNTRSINHIINPLTPKISLVILLTFCQRILILLVWRIWYQIK